ncbi:MAG TPA: DNA-3-methyladenine glycosylase I [Candidatus Eremiobacteraceae bacterium]|nr:DNA-3-methyladenine glycosylase I [Candidatus Eremiobacteraceae bacterium]
MTLKIAHKRMPKLRPAKAQSLRMRRRCDWATNEPELTYHDREWGRPTRDEHRLFECLVLEGAQAGLSWNTILRKRDGYRTSFANFDPAKVARFNAARIDALSKNPAIVRHRQKVQSAVANAKAFLAIQAEFGSFARYLKSNAGASPDTLSKDLRSRGFNFVGPTIVRAFMQAIGMLDDHQPHCWRYKAKSRP